MNLTDEEVEALRALLAMLATMEERAIKRDGRLEVTAQLWRETVALPAQRLRRVSEWRKR